MIIADNTRSRPSSSQVSMHPYLNASEFRRDFRAVCDGRQYIIAK